MHMPAAKGLFHKVGAQSGGNLTYRDTDPGTSIQTQQMVVATMLKNLGLDGKQFDKLKTVAYKDLLAAGTAASRSVATEVGRQNLGWM